MICVTPDSTEMPNPNDSIDEPFLLEGDVEAPEPDTMTNPTKE